jgi:hypothetical protein
MEFTDLVHTVGSGQVQRDDEVTRAATLLTKQWLNATVLGQIGPLRGLHAYENPYTPLGADYQTAETKR